jgi:uncharacterized membrane protein YdbT with pleckstrin-like domain
VQHSGGDRPAAPGTIVERRPDRRLLYYYLMQAVLSGPLFPIVALARVLRFRTLHYLFDDEGVSMRWGLLFRREVSLTYARIQDLHLVSNVVERWLGLGRIQVQTASGSAKAEMVVEGLPDFESLRDRLYARMRGAAAPPARDVLDDVADALREVAGELRALRLSLGHADGPAA